MLARQTGRADLKKKCQAEVQSHYSIRCPAHQYASSFAVPVEKALSTGTVLVSFQGEPLVYGTCGRLTEETGLLDYGLGARYSQPESLLKSARLSKASFVSEKRTTR